MALPKAVWTPQTINYENHNSTTSLFSPNYTYSFDKYSCIRGFWYAHMIFNYIIFLSGLAAMVVRALPPRYKATHAWLGRIYLLSMTWSTATSLLIHNTGLPVSVLTAFSGVLIGLTIGWCAIVIHRYQLQNRALEVVTMKLNKGSKLPEGGIAQAFGEAKKEIVESKTFMQRLISLKTLHGVLFFMSWFNIAGRIFASNQSGDFTCNTYPIYKPINTVEFEGVGKPLTLVTSFNPEAYRLPWVRVGGDTVWALITIGGAMLVALGWLALTYYLGIQRERKRTAEVVDEELQQSPTGSSGGL